MAAKPTKREDCYDDCHKVEFKTVIGAKTLEDGGHFGDLLKIARIHINEAKKNSELTEGMAGEVYAKAIESAMAQATQFGLQRSKMQIDIALVDSQVDYQKHKLQVERDQFDLSEYIEKAKLNLETKKTLSDILATQANVVHIETQDKQIHQGIKQSQQEIKQIIANMQKMECECDVLVKTSNSKMDVEKASIIKMSVDNLIGVQTSNSKMLVDKASIVKMDTENRVSVSGNNSKIALESAQTKKIGIDAGNETKLNSSKIGLNNTHIAKMKCDCTNQGLISSAQANLYTQQMLGFRDNARQKLFETQMQGYAMVFEAAEFVEDQQGYVPDMFTSSQLDNTFAHIAGRTFC